MQVREPASSEAALERGLAALVWDGIFSQALGVFTGGTLLTGCALELGASPAFIGLLAAIPFFAQLAHVPAVVLIEKVRRRRSICLAATLAARLMLLPLAAVPFIADHDLALSLLLAAFAVLTPLGAVGGCAWMSWTCDLVPHHRLGDVFGGRQLRSNVSAVLAGLLGAAIVNFWCEAVPGWRAGGYAGVFALAVAAAMASTWCLTRMPEVPMPPPRPVKLRALFARPFRESNFRRLMTFLGCWQFVANLALPLFPVWLVQHLHYGITTAIALGIVSQLAMIAAVPVWGRLCDRFSNKTVVALCAPLFLCCPFGWVLAVAPAPHALTLPILVLLQLVLGAALAGLDLCSGNMALKLAPRGEATVFLGANGLVKSLCAGCAPIVGGFLMDHLTALDLPFIPAWAGIRILGLQPWSFFFIATTVLGAVALTRLARIEESGEVRLGMLLESARRRLSETWQERVRAARPDGRRLMSAGITLDLRPRAIRPLVTDDESGDGNNEIADGASAGPAWPALPSSRASRQARLPVAAE